jgi:hypothetical protein
MLGKKREAMKHELPKYPISLTFTPKEIDALRYAVSNARNDPPYPPTDRWLEVRAAMGTVEGKLWELRPRVDKAEP